MCPLCFQLIAGILCLLDKNFILALPSLFDGLSLGVSHARVHELVDLPTSALRSREALLVIVNLAAKCPNAKNPRARSEPHNGG